MENKFLIDTHCHLNDDMLYPKIDEVFKNAYEVGVTHFLVIGWDYKSSLLAIKIANKYPNCYAAIGIHPENIDNVDDNELNKVLSLSKDKKVVAIGEIGLDYYWCKDENKRQIQKEFFIKQIEYANKNNLPICIHNRDAFADCLQILKQHTPTSHGVMHCYSGSVESLKEILDLGLYISLGGPLTFKNAKTPKDVCYAVPLDRLLLETDCPYLPPHPLRGTINEPCNIKFVLNEAANIKEISKSHLADITFKNACNLFRLK